MKLADFKTTESAVPLSGVGIMNVSRDGALGLRSVSWRQMSLGHLSIRTIEPVGSPIAENGDA
jgi:hypothetical protein